MQGARVSAGGEHWVVELQGPSTVRARVLDQLDGSYLTEYSATRSGMYNHHFPFASEHARRHHRGLNQNLYTLTTEDYELKLLILGRRVRSASSRCETGRPYSRVL
jgi:hypothetical protein